jgi:hypothetical protein
MLISAIVLGTISVLSLSIWAHGLFVMCRKQKPDIRKIDEEHTEKSSSFSISGFSRQISYQRIKGYEISAGQGMTYGELEEGIRSRDPGAILFIRIAAGFGVGLLSGVAAIGAAVVAAGKSDGYFMMGFSVFFGLLFACILVDQRRRSRKKP